MKNEILINAERGETRVAVLERGLCTELLIERTGSEDVVGSVIKGRVTRVLPGMQAAFVDVGLDKAAFLYAGDYYDDDGPDDDEPKPRGRGGRNGRGGGRNGGGRGRSGGRNRQPPRIDTLLREGEEIVVQVAKEAIGTKGARITSNISIAGRHLVLTPRSKRVGVSRRIDSDKERRRLREIVTRLRPGDLVFFHPPNKVRHVGIYLGNRRFVHAPASGREVTITSLDGAFYRRAFVRAGRPAE